MSLAIKQVIQIAREQFKVLLPELAIGKDTKTAMQLLGSPLENAMESDIRLEEIEKEGENWAVTLSVPNPNYDPVNLLEGIRNARHLARIAKVIIIDGSEGKLVALKERAA